VYILPGSQVLDHGIHLSPYAPTLLCTDLDKSHSLIANPHLIKHAIQETDFARADQGAALEMALTWLATANQHTIDPRTERQQRYLRVNPARAWDVDHAHILRVTL